MPLSLLVFVHFSYNMPHTFEDLLYISLPCKMSFQEGRAPLFILVFLRPNTEVGTRHSLIPIYF